MRGAKSSQSYRGIENRDSMLRGAEGCSTPGGHQKIVSGAADASIPAWSAYEVHEGPFDDRGQCASQLRLSVR
jgi:hypothetical protein